jgi:pimeloyl-ACP methyl ester carboxylesterase
MTQPTDRVTVADGVDLDATIAGDRGAPTVILLHGFPESAYSWRHQIPALADAGWRVIAPDQRGYAHSAQPEGVSAYRADHLCDDVIALLDHDGADQAVVIGHDWGAIVTWHIAQRHPDRCRGIIAASVPYTPWPDTPTTVLRHQHGDDFFYINYFQEPDVPEAELDADPERFLRAIIHVASGEGMATLAGGSLPAAGTGCTEYFEHIAGGRPLDLPPWLSPADLAVYTEQFTHSGFGPAINWYRNLDANHELFSPIGESTITMPTGFIAGAVDPVILTRPGYVEQMNERLPHHRGNTLLPGIGHWVQQEDPAGFNQAMFDLLATM